MQPSKKPSSPSRAASATPAEELCSLPTSEGPYLFSEATTERNAFSVGQIERDDGRAHARVLVGAGGGREDLNIGEMDRRAKQIAGAGKRRIEPERPARGVVFGLAAVEAGDEFDGRVDRHSRGDFARIVAAHAV